MPKPKQPPKPRPITEAEIRNLSLDVKAWDEKIDLTMAEKSLYHFSKQAWDSIDTDPFKDGWHFKAVADHLQATFTGDIKRLIINIPPRCAKSLQCAVFFPSWVWIHKPETCFLTASHSKELAKRDTVKMRDLIMSPWYQKRWGSKFSLKEDKNQVLRFENDKRGERIATSVNSKLTGEGTHYIIIDDPMDVKESKSRTAMAEVNDWYSSKLSTRFKDAESLVIIIVGQRLGLNDLTGYILENDEDKEWTHLVLPFEFEAKSKCRTFMFEDPRTEESENIWPAGFPPSVAKQIKARLKTPFNIASQLQQKPFPKGGSIFNRDSFKYFTLDDLPSEYTKAQGWDTAFKVGAENDYSACITAIRADANFYVLDVYKDRLLYPQLKNMIMQKALEHKPHRIVIEDKASGQSVIQDLKRTVLPAPVMPYKLPGGNKEDRASIISDLPTNGYVYLLKDAPWLDDFLSELEAFPHGSFDDQVDAFVIVLAYLQRLLGMPLIITAD